MNKSNTLFKSNTAYRNIHTIIQCISENTNTIMIPTIYVQYNNTI